MERRRSHGTDRFPACLLRTVRVPESFRGWLLLRRRSEPALPHEDIGDLILDTDVSRYRPDRARSFSQPSYVADTIQATCKTQRVNSGTISMSNVLLRDRVSLDGDWNVIVDPYDMGYVGILGDRTNRGFFRDFRPRHPGDRVEYDFDASPTLTVPGDWNTQDERLFYYEGTVWYRRKINVAPGWFEDGRVFLYVGAANHTSRVFLDGEELAIHVGGFSPFAVELTGRLDPGQHSLVIQVDNRREPDRIPAMRCDWWNFGGLTRAVELVSVPKIFLRHAWVTMSPSGAIIGGVEIDGADAPVELRIPACGIDTTVNPGERFEFAASPERWSPGAPVLHDVQWSCEDDQLIDEVGFRTVRTEGEKILVNDEVTFLRGISLHAEATHGGRRSHGADDASELYDHVERLGANFTRLAHYQHDEHMLREADRRGVLAWCEMPVYWSIAFDEPHVLENAIEQLDELILRDRSRASVIFWSIANETPNTPERTAFLSQLASRARQLDDTRLVSAALLTPPTAATDQHVDDPLGAAIDTVAVNQYLGWYYGERSDIATTTWSCPHGKPIIFTEFGAGAKAGRHGRPDEIWTEEFQAAVYEAQLVMINANRSDLGRGPVAGISPWILKDFRAPVRVLPGIQDGYNRKGLLSEEGDEKLAFNVLREFYQ